MMSCELILLFVANVLFYEYTKVCLSISQVFHFFAIINSAAMNICFHIFSVLLGIYLQIILLSHIATLCLTF